MLSDAFADVGLIEIGLILGITIFAGFVKGAVGFAMPLIMVSGISSIVDPKLALASIILPIVVSNFLQTFRQGIGPAIEASKEFWRYLVVVCLFIFIAAQVAPLIPSRVFYLVLGIPVIILSSIQLFGVILRIAPERRIRAEWIAGVLSGTLGGLAGTWGPLTVLFLLAIDTPRARQMVVQGVIYGLGSITLLVAHLQSGILNAETAPFSAALVVPGLVGMWLGFQVQDRLNQALFRKATLVVLVIAGLNLIRKGLMG